MLTIKPIVFVHAVYIACPLITTDCNFFKNRKFSSCMHGHHFYHIYGLQRLGRTACMAARNGMLYTAGRKRSTIRGKGLIVPCVCLNLQRELEKLHDKSLPNHTTIIMELYTVQCTPIYLQCEKLLGLAGGNTKKRGNK